MEMDVKAAIANHLKDIDDIIGQNAARPEEVRADGLLRTLFLVAFPPDGLPSKITCANDPVELDRIRQEHRPYYSGEKTTKRKRDPKTTELVKTNEKLVLNLRKSARVRAALAQDGHLNDRGTQSGTSKGSETPDATAKKFLKCRRQLIAKRNALPNDKLREMLDGLNAGFLGEG